MTVKIDSIFAKYSVKILDEILKYGVDSHGFVKNTLSGFKHEINGCFQSCIADIFKDKKPEPPFLTAIESFVTKTDLRRLSLEDCFIKFAQVIDEYKEDRYQQGWKAMTQEEEIEETKRRG